MGLVFPPTGWQPRSEDALMPDKTLRRDYVFGFNSTVKNAVHLTSPSECVYPVAAMVVVLDLVENRQRVFEGHTNDVTSLAWNAAKRICASGQAEPKGKDGPFVAVWSPDDVSRTLAELVHPNRSRQISAVALSPDGQTAVSFAADDHFCIFIWRGFLAKERRGGPFAEEWKPLRPASVHSVSAGRQLTDAVFPSTCFTAQGDGSFYFYTVGEKGFKLWSVGISSSAAVALSSKKGTFGKSAAPKSPTFIAEAGDGFAWLVGDNGSFYVVQGNTVIREKRLTSASPPVALGCVAALPGGRWLAGAADGKIYFGCTDPVPRVLETWSLAELGGEASLLCSTSTPRLSDVSVVDSTAVFGTSNHSLLWVDLGRKELVRVLQVSHGPEAWAMDFHPSLAILASGSSAGDVRFWNVAERRPAVGRVLKIGIGVWAMAFSPDGSLLALGCDKGFLEVDSFPALQPILQARLSPAGERITDLRFDEAGQQIVACCWDQVVYLLRVVQHPDSAPEVFLHRTLTGNSSSPQCAMFSADGQFVMSNAKDTQILFWRTRDGHRVTSTSAFRDTRWQKPWTCLLGWPVIGIWGDSDYDQTDINTVCSSLGSDEVVAIGDDYGKVKLFRFPTPFLEPQCQVCPGHASHVTVVRFSRTDMLASLGGDDHSIVLWSLERTAPRMGPWGPIEESRYQRDLARQTGAAPTIPQQVLQAAPPAPQPAWPSPTAWPQQEAPPKQAPRAPSRDGGRRHRNAGQGAAECLRWD